MKMLGTRRKARKRTLSPKRVSQGVRKVDGERAALKDADALKDAFIPAILEDFLLHGAQTIAKLRAERPADYFKLVASLLPKQTEAPKNAIEALPGDELAELVAAARKALQILEDSGFVDELPGGGQPAENLPPLS